ncbi:MAG: hypothetical protein LBV07_00100 [Syntrophobacterales bacterium]|jgi:hypothetical protein|nr:hypothetical protein [Syntrophobacterales bacterium]
MLMETNLTLEQIQDSSEDAKTFVLRMMENNSQIGAYLRNIENDSECVLSEDDWNYLAAWVKLTLGYPPDSINAKRLEGDF